MALNKKMVFLPYDFDTAIGTNNEGALVFDYTLEDIDQLEGGANVFNGQDSILWNNLREMFPEEIREMYYSLRSSGKLSYEIVEKMFEDHQGKWPERIFNEDAWYKYLAPLEEDGDAAYLSMLQGAKAEQRKWWLYNRFRFMDSKFLAGDALTDVITLRAYQKGDITVTPYADIYVSIKYGSYTPTGVRTTRGTATTVTCPLSTFNDTEIYVYSASQIASVGDLAEQLVTTRQQIWMYETGKAFPTSDVIENICKLLYITPNELFGEAFKGKTLVITGGTGSFGSTVLKHFLTTEIGEIRIISRDEKKQDWMRHTLQAQYPEYASKVQFYVGDVRNIDSVRDVMFGADYVFHAAALKEVPSCEFFPMEAVRTNIIGTDNVITAAVEAKVKRVVFLSTDKAAYPINAMGASKMLGEKVVTARAQKAFERGGTVLACTRYGNVMCSRGSVIPLFIDQIKRKAPITITDPEMTRFLMNLDEAVDLVAFAFEHAEPGDLFVQKADASTIGDLADGVMKLFGETDKKIIGSRHGEKLFETLIGVEEMVRATDMGSYYRIAPDNRTLSYDNFYSKGTVNTEEIVAYTSHNTTRLDVDGVVQKLLTTDYVREELEGRPHIVEA